MERIAALLLSLAMLLSASSCGQKDTPPSSAIQSVTDQSTVDVQEPVSPYPVVLTDQAGREVTLQARPERIVSGYYISTSLLIALGQQDRLVGIEAKADKRPIYRLSAPELLDLPSVGSAKEFDLEGCAALEPDLAILPLKLKEAAATLEGLGIPVLLIDPESQELLEETIALVSAAVDSQGPEGTMTLSDHIAVTQSLLEGAMRDVERPRAYLAGNSSFLSTAGGNMYQSDMLAQAGGENVAQDIQDTYWVQVDYEQILAWDPEYIILASDASYTCEDVLSDPDLAGCTAVVNGDVYQVPNKAEAWDSPVPSGILGSVWLASVLHPDRCSQEDFEITAEEYYERFYGFSYAQA